VEKAGREIPPLRGPTRQNSARKRKSGRSGPFDSAQGRRDDSGEKSGPPPSYGGRAEDEPYKRRRNPRAQARVPVPLKSGENQEHRPFEAPLEARGKLGKQECLCHQRQEKSGPPQEEARPKSTGKSACATSHEARVTGHETRLTRCSSGRGR
jgi:hypothetical protein